MYLAWTHDQSGFKIPLKTEWGCVNGSQLLDSHCHCSLAFTEESSFQGFLGGAGFHPSTVVK